MKIKCAIFDFDGTLFDSMFIWDTVGEIYLRSFGKEPEIITGINQAIEHFYDNFKRHFGGTT